MDFSRRVLLFALDDFGYGTRCTATPISGSPFCLSQGYFSKWLMIKKADIAEDIGGHDVTGIEHGGGIDCTDGQGHAFQNLRFLNRISSVLPPPKSKMMPSLTLRVLITPR